jgi:hypothetical protein
MGKPEDAMTEIKRIEEAKPTIDAQDIRQKRRVQIIWNREMTEDQMRQAQGKHFTWPEELQRPTIPYFIGFAYC